MDFPVHPWAHEGAHELAHDSHSLAEIGGRLKLVMSMVEPKGRNQGRYCRVLSDESRSLQCM